jgi:hypothetical protein
MSSRSVQHCHPLLCTAVRVIAMPRYFFHIRDRGRMIADEEGIDLPDMETEKDECQKAIRSVLEDDEWRKDLSPNAELHVVDELGRTVLIVPFSDESFGLDA